MADLFLKQAKQYSEARPNYPEELLQFIVSKTPNHDLAWDVGTGSGQAARSLAGIFKNVIATDASQKQLDFAPKLPNVRYQCTPPNMSMEELERDVAAQSSVDIVTIAQAMHWFDLHTFYKQVKWVLKKPHGVIAAWCYTVLEVNDIVDFVFQRFYAVDSDPYWDPARKLVDDKYRSIDFPFEPVDGVDHTGPFEFKTERVMDLDGYFTYIRSWSAYQTAREKGVELLRDDVIEDFKRAWNEDGNGQKIVKFPVHLRIGNVGNLN
uniref:Putative embryo-abundant family protein n=1 Tax=Davidia involucrata TaxID=16924 RepID=A0A5B7B7J5_DAVIN